MKPLTLHSERFRPEGGASGFGILRALGKPRLDPISVLMRESIQNSWDARVPGAQSRRLPVVGVTARLAACAPAELEALRKTVFVSLPRAHPLRQVLQPGLRRLVLEDRGTIGLAGPVYVERAPKPEDRFVNFIRLFGRASDGPVGGGTFGYGKAVYFSASAASTIIVHTRCDAARGQQERLIAMSLCGGDSEGLGTGRHWWGIPSKRHRGVTEPVTGVAARQLARSLGFVPFADEETGTSIMILGPRFDGPAGSNPRLLAECIAESMVMWFWPRMLGGGDGRGKLDFAVECDGESVAVPDPRKESPFAGYSRAFSNLLGHMKDGREVEPPHAIHEVRSRRPVARLGYLSLVRAFRQPRRDYAVVRRVEGEPAIDDHVLADQLADVTDLPAHCRHVALIRAPGQVIRYLQCRSDPAAVMEYMGVFLVSGDHNHSDRPPDDIELAFSRAEPPSHDDWIPDELDDEWQRRYVRVGLREIRNLADRFSNLQRTEIRSADQDPLGAVSKELGELMTAPADGASRRAERGRNGGGRAGEGPAVRLSLLGDGFLEEDEGRPVFVLPFRIEGTIEAPIRVRAIPRVLLAGGGAESEPPEGDELPRVVVWKSDRRAVRKAQLGIKEGDTGDWTVTVTVPPEAMVSVTLSIEAGGA